jgi:hypothetical protein
MAAARPIIFFIFCLACTLLPARAGSQIHAETATKPNFSGEWTLNRELSDAPSPADDERAGDYRRENGRRGGGFGGFGRGGFGGYRRPHGPVQDAPDDRAKALDAIRDARSPSPSLTISHSAVNIAITDTRGRTRFFQTTGAVDKHQFDSGTLDSTTSWSGDQLVVQYDLGGSGRLTYTYALAAGSRQLVVRVRFDGGPSFASRGARTIKYVYDSARPK